jgi:hypothetical protein
MFFSEKDVNRSFNNFLNTYLRLFDSSLKKENKKTNHTQTNYTDDHRNKEFMLKKQKRKF